MGNFFGSTEGNKNVFKHGLYTAEAARPKRKSPLEAGG
jgi:hypothetical protein